MFLSVPLEEEKAAGTAGTNNHNYHREDDKVHNTSVQLITFLLRAAIAILTATSATMACKAAGMEAIARSETNLCVWLLLTCLTWIWHGLCTCVGGTVARLARETESLTNLIASIMLIALIECNFGAVVVWSPLSAVCCKLPQRC